MPKNFRKVLAWSKTHDGKKLIRFGLSSVVTTSVSFLGIVITYGFHIIHGVLGATLFGNLIAVIPGYYLSRSWAWGKKGKSHIRKEVLPYLSISGMGISFSMFGASFVKHLVHTHHWHHIVNTFLIAGVNLLSFGVFWVLKVLLFNKIFHTNKLRDIDAHLSDEEKLQISSRES